MQRKIWMPFGLIVILLATTLLLRTTPSATPAAKKEIPVPTPACCKATVTDCPIKNKVSPSGEIIIDNLSRQFIIVSPTLY